VVALTSEQVTKLFAACTEPFWLACITLAVDTGLREAEILGLKYSDFAKDGKLVVARTCDTIGKQKPKIKEGTKANRKGVVVTKTIWVNPRYSETLKGASEGKECRF
jgi:integrase